MDMPKKCLVLLLLLLAAPAEAVFENEPQTARLIKVFDQGSLDARVGDASVRDVLEEEFGIVFASPQEARIILAGHRGLIVGEWIVSEMLAGRFWARMHRLAPKVGRIFVVILRDSASPFVRISPAPRAAATYAIGPRHAAGANPLGEAGVGQTLLMFMKNTASREAAIAARAIATESESGMVLNRLDAYLAAARFLKTRFPEEVVPQLELTVLHPALPDDIRAIVKARLRAAQCEWKMLGGG